MNEDPKLKSKSNPTSNPKRFKPRLVKATKHGAMYASHLTEEKIESKGKRPNLKIIATRLTALFGIFLAGTAEAKSPAAKSSLNPFTQTYIVKEFDRFGSTELKRTYSSGTVFRGHFGAGWCSEIDGKINLYDGGEIRYRGCDTESADLVDSRASQRFIRRTATGFERLRDDGATQTFTANGYLEKINRRDGEIRILRDPEMIPIEITFQAQPGARIEKTRIDFYARESDTTFALVKSIGTNLVFKYRGQMLSEALEDRATKARYSYDDQLNMISRMSTIERETIDYDNREDRVTGIVRSLAFGQERLLLAIGRDEKSGMIEMKIEVERGAETHPVRILYNATTHRLQLDGDRNIARIILSLIRA